MTFLKSEIPTFGRKKHKMPPIYSEYIDKTSTFWLAIVMIVSVFMNSSARAEEEPSTYWKVVGVYSTIYCLWNEDYMTKAQALRWGEAELAKYAISRETKNEQLKNKDFSVDTSYLIYNGGGCAKIVKDPYYNFKK